MKLKLEIEGLRECEDALLSIGRAAKTALRNALLKAAVPIEADAEARAPKDTGRLTASIAISDRLKKGQRRAKRGVAEVFVGSTSSLAHLQEFGTAHHGPQPFLRPAFDANAGRALTIFRDELRTEIREARARAARKQARLLAKSRE